MYPKKKTQASINSKYKTDLFKAVERALANKQHFEDDEALTRIILNSGMDAKAFRELVESKGPKPQETKDKQKQLRELEQRKWLKKHDKSEYIDFDDAHRSKIKGYFNSLDSDGSGAIGVEELEDPLIALGICETREEIRAIVDEIDDNGNQEIEFAEFLDIIKGNIAGAKSNQAIIDFFKKMIDGKLTEVEGSKNLSFGTIINTIRRKKLKNALMETDRGLKQEGEKIMKAYAKILILKKLEEQNSETASKRDSVTPRSNEMEKKVKGKEATPSQRSSASSKSSSQKEPKASHRSSPGASPKF